MASRHVSEAEAAVKKAEKHMKTGLLKWQPDIDSAVDELQKAGLSYKNAKMPEKASEIHQRVAELQRQAGQPFQAAKTLELAGAAFRELNRHDESAKCSHKAATLYMEAGAFESAQSVLEKAGKQCAVDAPACAVDAYTRAADLAESGERLQQAGDFSSRAARLLIRDNKLQEAIPLLEQEQRLYCEAKNNAGAYKTTDGLVLVHLTLNSAGGAANAVDKARQEINGFATSEDEQLLATLLSGIVHDDIEHAVRALESPIFKFLDNEFAILARDLHAPLAARLRADDAGAGGGRNDQKVGASGPADDDVDLT